MNAFCRVLPIAVVLGLVVSIARGQNGDRRWERMDYGPFLSASVGLGDAVEPVHKGIVVRLRSLEGDDTDLHAVFDTDLLAWRCAWTGDLALRGIVFDGPHGTFPRIEGTPLFTAPAHPGVVPFEAAGTLRHDPRVEPWGPLSPALARWSGVHLDGDDVIFEYTVGAGRHRVLERVWAQPHGGVHAFVREITVETDRAGGPDGPAFASLVPGDPPTLAPSNGTIHVAVAPDGTALRDPAAAPRRVHDAVAAARPRWGKAISTRGIIDDMPDDDDVVDRIVRRKGDTTTTFDLVSADGGHLELVQRGAGVDEGPARHTVILRRAPARPIAVEDLDGAIGWWPSDRGEGTHERNAVTGADDLRLDGVTWRRGVTGRALDFDGTAAAWLDDVALDLAGHDLTIAAWVHTTADGTIFAIAPPEGRWAPDGATFFLRGGRLSFDVGWVGVVAGGPRIDDGAWHHIAATRRHRDGAVRLFVDGERVASGTLPLNDAPGRASFVARFGWTNDDFPSPSRFSGYMDGAMLLRRALADDDIGAVAAESGEPLVEATIVQVGGPPAPPRERPLFTLSAAGDGRAARLRLPTADGDATHVVRRRRGPRSVALAWATRTLEEPTGPTGPFRIDRLTWPEDNRFGSWLRFGGFDFLPARDGGDVTSAVISTWSGDLWRVDGLDEDIDTLRWTRVATGLNQPFGVAVRGDETLVLGRDQITRLNDRNGDGEADFLENVTNATRNSEHFHEPASGLLVTPDGGLMYIKAARHAKHALHDHHGAVLRVSPDGASTEVVARGFRAPIGLTRLPDGSLLGSDQEGHWTPANRINLIRPATDGAPPPFYGNGWAAANVAATRIDRGGERVRPPWDAEAEMAPPLCWLHPTVDRSPSSQVFVDHPAWGPLEGSVLGLSYGTGDVYLVLRDDVPGADGAPVTQGGIVKLGIQLPTGLLTGRIHPDTGDLYVCGLFGWSSDRTQPGGFHRIRPRTDVWRETLNVPHRVRSLPDGLELTFLHALDRSAATDATSWRVTAWNYRRTADYGSKTYDIDGRADARTTWTVHGATLADDGCTVRLRIDRFEPAMQVQVAWSIADAAGRPLEHEAHLTVHAVHPRAAARSETSVVYLVRHAEDLDAGLDPELVAAGRARAAALAALLRDAGIDHVHASDYKRTRDTAAPIAAALGVEVELYDPRRLAALVERLRTAGGRHLVVGHSNTTPRVVALLGGEAGPPIDEPTEFDRLYVVTTDASGAVRTERRRYGAPSGDRD